MKFTKIHYILCCYKKVLTLYEISFLKSCQLQKLVILQTRFLFVEVFESFSKKMGIIGTNKLNKLFDGCQKSKELNIKKKIRVQIRKEEKNAS